MAMVCHHCDNRPCVRPEHLYLGDATTNSADAVARDRIRPPFGEAHHACKLTSAQVAEIRSRSSETAVSLAAEFGVSDVPIRDIRKGRGRRRG